MATSNHQPIGSLDEAIGRLYDLNVGVVGTGRVRHERPHKPLMILTVLDLLASGEADPDRIRWSSELRVRFSAYFNKVRTVTDGDTPANPFLYLSSDGFWEPFITGDGETRVLDRPPTAGDAEAGRVFASLTNGIDQFVRLPEQRVCLREAIVSRYFAMKRPFLTSLFLEKSAPYSNPVVEDDDGYVPPITVEGRSSAFRRKVLEVYDSQCAACGLRIKLPDSQVTFVDGAHLIPFNVTRNDHPTNGIALCKNHHWAMDRFLIVPTRERRWKVAPHLDSRRSPGEKDLCLLDDQPVLPPHDDAFLPSIESLIWRSTRLTQS